MNPFIEIENPFVEIDQQARADLPVILTEVLSSLLSEHARPTEEPLLPQPCAVARLAIHDLDADRYAAVEVQLGIPLARTVAARMLSIPRPGDADVLDAVAEVVNIAGGNIKTMLCRHARLSLPDSWIGEPNRTPDPPDGGVRIRATVLGQVAQLVVHPDVAHEGLSWPPRSSDEILERSS